MIEATPPATLFGIPLVLRRPEAEAIATAIRELWVVQLGKQPHGSLEKDLDALYIFFNPISTGRRLRDLLAKRPAQPSVQSRLLRPPLVIGEPGDYLVTLEGRAALAALTEAIGTQDENIILDPDLVYSLEHAVYQRYRDWGLQRIQSVLRLRAGTAQTIALPSLGWLLLLLVNGSISRETAIRRLPDGDAQRKLDTAIGHVVSAFCNVLDPDNRLDSRHFSLYSGYAVTEARRRLPDALGPEQDLNYVVPGGEDRVLRLVAAELRRPLRSPTREQIVAAFDALTNEYQRQLPTFAALGQAHERRLDTRRLRQRLEDRFAAD